MAQASSVNTFDPTRPKWVEGGFEIHEGNIVDGGGDSPNNNSQPAGPGSRGLTRTHGGQQVNQLHSGGGNSSGGGIPQENLSRRSRRDLLTASFEDIVREEHPAVLRAAGNYSRLGGRAYKPTKTFLPLASKRPVKVGEQASNEYDVGKKSYLNVCDSLHVATDELVGHMKQEMSMEVFSGASWVSWLDRYDLSS